MSPSPAQYTNLGTALVYGGSCFSGIEMFRKAVDLSPDNEIYQGNLADAYRCSGQDATAVRTYRRAIELARESRRVNPNDTRLAGRLSMYLAKTGQFDEAESLLASSLEQVPRSATLLYYRAVLLTLRSQYGQAAGALRAAITAGYPQALADADPELKFLGPHLGN
jgi:Flp pilus assembly protein TadD